MLPRYYLKRCACLWILKFQKEISKGIHGKNIGLIELASVRAFGIFVRLINGLLYEALEEIDGRAAPLVRLNHHVLFLREAINGINGRKSYSELLESQ